MFLYFLLIGSIASAPSEEFRGVFKDGGITYNDEAFLMGIVPSGYSPQKLMKKFKSQLPDFLDKTNENHKRLEQLMDKGFAMKGLTFNIYDDDMRDAALQLFHILKDANPDELPKLEEWVSHNINRDIYSYAWRLASLYNSKNLKDLPPPFILNPNYFVNAETIRKAAKLKINDGNFNSQEAKVNQFYKVDDIISINTNYSGWNLPHNGCEEEINYFREDIGLNSYYYGIHLMHPFWMSNEELDDINPRHAEYYYYRHQQLMARRLLEIEHLKQGNYSFTENCKTSYNPFLVHDNGLSFPIRSSTKGEWNQDRAFLTSIDIAIKECISRGILLMYDGKAVNLTEDNHIELLAKLIRANLDGVKTAKIIRSLYGYGGDGYPINQYNPAPSVLHHPETALRDPNYWNLIQYMLNYFKQYQEMLEPYDLLEYETADFIILEASHSKITTYYDYYQFNINKAVEDENFNYIKSPLVLTARQKRLNHLSFSVNFNVEAKAEIDGVVRLFLGPQCSDETCWNNYVRFFELDTYIFKFKQGSNILQWSSDKSDRFSFDDYFNLETPKIKENKFNLFKFPENLLLPKGHVTGLNLTMFIMITPTESSEDREITSENRFHAYVETAVDDKPLGFPFHRQSAQNVIFGSNFRFFNITIFHKMQPHESKGFFSPNLL